MPSREMTVRHPGQAYTNKADECRLLALPPELFSLIVDSLDFHALFALVCCSRGLANLLIRSLYAQGLSIRCDPDIINTSAQRPLGMNTVRRFFTPDQKISQWHPRSIHLIHWACRQRRGYTSLVRGLLEAGLDPDMSDSHGYTALHSAACRNHIDIAGALIEHGADVDAVAGSGETPLCLAAYWGNTGIVRLLLHAGANPNIRKVGGISPLHAAIQQRHLGVTEEILRRKNVEWDGTTVYDGCTPLHDAINSGSKFVQLLLDAGAGATAECRNRLGETPVHCAVKSKCTEVLTVLLANPTAAGVYRVGLEMGEFKLSSDLVSAAGPVLRIWGEDMIDVIQKPPQCRRKLEHCIE